VDDRGDHSGPGGASAALTLLASPRLALASPVGGKRFVFIIQRGAADGLATIAPTGDPRFAAVRGAFAEDSGGGTKLDSFFTLHPALTETGKLYSAREAMFVHAIASPYRERSHFDGQNVLETGGPAAYRLRDGWMNRLLGLLPKDRANAVALSPTVPTILRGSRQVSSYAASKLPDASDDLLTRVGALYEADAQLHPLWEKAMQTRAAVGDKAGGAGRNGAAVGELAAKLLLAESGARIALIESNGWDTHANQRGRLAAQLRGLDQMVAALKRGLGPAWSDTLVIVATEFGRTARPNGTGGTDHGTASAAMLLGGAVAGGKVIADWPGLGASQLHEGRDLKPTASLDALIAAAVSHHYRLDPALGMRTLFPESRSSPFGQMVVRA
jgi:uncharacterized protein (DUF1501 family)